MYMHVQAQAEPVHLIQLVYINIIINLMKAILIRSALAVANTVVGEE